MIFNFNFKYDFYIGDFYFDKIYNFYDSKIKSYFSELNNNINK